MSNEEIIELARRMRAAQKAYYAEKFPGNKKPLLVAARQLESQLDKALAAIGGLTAATQQADKAMEPLTRVQFCPRCKQPELIGAYACRSCGYEFGIQTHSE